jgi:hypothetical protein
VAVLSFIIEKHLLASKMNYKLAFDEAICNLHFSCGIDCTFLVKLRSACAYS